MEESQEHGMFEKILLTAEAMDLSKRLSKIKKMQTQWETKKYLRKLKIKEVEFQALKVVNFQKFTLVFLALISVCCMSYVVEVALKEQHTQVHRMWMTNDPQFDIIKSSNPINKWFIKSLTIVCRS